MQSDIFSGVCRRAKRPVTHTLSLESPIARFGIFCFSRADTGRQSRISGKRGNPVRRNVAGLDPRWRCRWKRNPRTLFRYSPQHYGANLTLDKLRIAANRCHCNKGGNMTLTELSITIWRSGGTNAGRDLRLGSAFLGAAHRVCEVGATRRRMAACARNGPGATSGLCRFEVITHDPGSRPSPVDFALKSPSLGFRGFAPFCHCPPLAGNAQRPSGLPVIVVQRQDMAGSDGVAGTVRIVA